MLSLLGSTRAQGFPRVGPLPDGTAGTCGLRTDHVHTTREPLETSLHARGDLAKPTPRSHVP